MSTRDEYATGYHQDADRGDEDMRTAGQVAYDLRRACTKRGPSTQGWRWIKTPTALELAAWRRLKP